MKAEFLRAAKFPHADKDQKDKELFYPIGVHDVPEHVVAHPYFKLLVKDKMIIEPDSSKVSVPEDQAARHKKMAEKVLKGEAIGADLGKKPAAPPVDEEKVDEVLEEAKSKSKKK